jgi:hypothetical protein
LRPSPHSQIFSYLQPSTLYYVSTLNSSLHRFFTGFTVKSLWRKALAVTEFPKLGGEEVEPRKVAALILERVCEVRFLCLLRSSPFPLPSFLRRLVLTLLICRFAAALTDSSRTGTSSSDSAGRVTSRSTSNRPFLLFPSSPYHSSLCPLSFLPAYSQSIACPFCTDGFYSHSLVPASDIGKDAIYADFHPATTMCAIAASCTFTSSHHFPCRVLEVVRKLALTTSPFSPPDPIKNERSRKNDHCYYLPDLHSLDEELVRLQIVDESESQKKYASGPEQDEVQKTLAKATKLKKRSWYGGRGEQAKALEEGIVEQFTPRVRKFIEERGLLKKEREIVRLLPPLS